jgi:hypothetical protein
MCIYYLFFLILLKCKHRAFKQSGTFFSLCAVHVWVKIGLKHPLSVHFCAPEVTEFKQQGPDSPLSVCFPFPYTRYSRYNHRTHVPCVQELSLHLIWQGWLFCTNVGSIGSKGQESPGFLLSTHWRSDEPIILTGWIGWVPPLLVVASVVTFAMRFEKNPFVIWPRASFWILPSVT